MKLPKTLLTAAAMVVPYYATAKTATTTTTTTSRNLRGKVVQTRTVYLEKEEKHASHDTPSTSTQHHFDHESHINVHPSNKHIRQGGEPRSLHHFDRDSSLDVHNHRNGHNSDSSALHHFDHESHLNLHDNKHLRHADVTASHHHFTRDVHSHLNLHTSHHGGVHNGDTDALHHFDHTSHLNLRVPEPAHIHHWDAESHINLRRPEPLVDPHARLQNQPHHFVRVHGKTFDGETRSMVLDLDKLEDKLPHESSIFTKNNHVFHTETKSGNMRGESTTVHWHADDNSHHLRSSHPNTKSEHGLHHETPVVHFDGHDVVEKQHEHHYHPHHNVPTQTHKQTHKQNRTHNEDKQDDFDWKRDRSMYSLPTGLASHYNETLFEELHNAPFRVYAEALGHELDEGESFPVFALPQWMNKTGVFTGFSKKATPLIFENVQFLLHWDDIVATATSPISDALQAHIDDNNFHASLIIGKSVGNGANVPFIGMVICYYQYGQSKSVLVPFSKLEDFFDNTAEKHLLDPNTKSLEIAALHSMLEEKRTNSSSFYHPALAHSEERKAQLEDMEIVHFQKLFQLLIRRSFLFAFGFADCLLNEPHDLRECLDDTFYHLIEMETTTRGALDDQVIEKLAEINETFHSRVSEACISVQGSGILYGSGSCYNTNDLGAFVVGNFASF